MAQQVHKWASRNLDAQNLGLELSLMCMKTPLLSCLAVLLSLSSFAQDKNTPIDLSKLAKEQKLHVFNRTATPLADGQRKGVRLSEKENDGVAWLDNISFSDGTIELDIRGKDVLQGSFVGVAFHGVDEKKFEAVYFRPFNFRAADPIRKIHAVQYVYHPEYPWARLRKEFEGQYEKAVEPAPNPTEWFHVKIVIKAPQITVYVDRETTPCLTVKKLSTQKTGRLGLWVGNNSGGDFANLLVSPAKN